MDVTGFLSVYGDLVGSSEGEEPFSVFQMMCPGLSSAKLGKLINRAVNFVDDGEIYCELGTYVGYTLISASLHNNSTPCVGIDNFQGLGTEATDVERKRVKDRLLVNLSHFNYGNQQIMDADYKGVRELTKPIGVFFVDAYHSREEVYNGLKWGHNKLADEAIIFVDDITCWGVSEGVADWMREHGDEYCEFFRMNNYYPPESNVNEQWGKSFWHGLSIIKFKRNKQGETEDAGNTDAEGCQL